MEFPRLDNKMFNMFIDNDLPSNKAIIKIVEYARLDAIKDLKGFNLELEYDELDLRCQLTFKNDNTMI